MKQNKTYSNLDVNQYFESNIDVKQQLKNVGYSCFKANVGYDESDIHDLELEFSKLELDTHAPKITNRYRRHGNGIIIPWSKEQLHWIPPVFKNGASVVGYNQGKDSITQSMKIYAFLIH